MANRMANRPGMSMSHISQERSRFQINAERSSKPAVTPSVMVRMPEKCSKSLETSRNRTMNKSEIPTAHQPSGVRGIPKK